jgi:hypothetical protein
MKADRDGRFARHRPRRRVAARQQHRQGRTQCGRHEDAVAEHVQRAGVRRDVRDERAGNVQRPQAGGTPRVGWQPHCDAVYSVIALSLPGYGPLRQEQIDRFTHLPPLERLGTPEDIANVVSFLAGPDGGWVNRQVLRANGGYA